VPVTGPRVRRQLSYPAENRSALSSSAVNLKEFPCTAPFEASAAAVCAILWRNHAVLGCPGQGPFVLVQASWPLRSRQGEPSLPSGHEPELFEERRHVPIVRATANLAVSKLYD
jgi:hypothetical protein